MILPRDAAGRSFPGEVTQPHEPGGPGPPPCGGLLAAVASPCGAGAGATGHAIMGNNANTGSGRVNEEAPGCLPIWRR